MARRNYEFLIDISEVLSILMSNHPVLLLILFMLSNFLPSHLSFFWIYLCNCVLCFVWPVLLYYRPPLFSSIKSISKPYTIWILLQNLTVNRKDQKSSKPVNYSLLNPDKITFEFLKAYLWSAADILRGSKDPLRTEWIYLMVVYTTVQKVIHYAKNIWRRDWN